MCSSDLPPRHRGRSRPGRPCYRRPYVYDRDMRAVTVAGLALIGICTVLGTASAQIPRQPAGLVPASPQASDLQVRLTPVGRMPMPMNPTSPVAAGSQLLLVDQGGFLYRWDGTTAVPVLTPRTLPRDVRLDRKSTRLNSSH